MSARGPVPPPTGGTTQTQEQAREMVRTYLTEEQEQIWFGLMETYDALLRALDTRMLAEHNMPLSAFEALMHITHADEGAISISDLAELVRLSPSQTSWIAIDLETQRTRPTTAQPGRLTLHRGSRHRRRTRPAPASRPHLPLNDPLASLRRARSARGQTARAHPRADRNRPPPTFR
jgi:hypothetical protein